MAQTFAPTDLVQLSSHIHVQGRVFFVCLFCRQHDDPDRDACVYDICRAWRPVPMGVRRLTITMDPRDRALLRVITDTFPSVQRLKAKWRHLSVKSLLLSPLSRRRLLPIDVVVCMVVPGGGALAASPSGVASGPVLCSLL